MSLIGIGERGRMFLAQLLLWAVYIVVGIFVFTAVEGSVKREERDWGHGDSFWFVFVLLTTIGTKQVIIISNNNTHLRISVL